MLGEGNEQAAKDALAAFSGGMQMGGGINMENAETWLELGASHVIVTSWLFDSKGRFLWDRLKSLASSIGKDRLVIDLSCKNTGSGWTVAMNRWQNLTDLNISYATLERLQMYCDEFLIHAADVEGLCAGVDEDLVSYLGKWSGLPMTYAGGVGSMEDVLSLIHI